MAKQFRTQSLILSNQTVTGDANFLYLNSVPIAFKGVTGLSITGSSSITGKINLSGQNGVSLFLNGNDINFSGQSNQLTQTGINLYSFASAISGNLATTGSTLDSKIESLSGSVASSLRPTVTGVNVTGGNSFTGLVSFTGNNIVITTITGQAGMTGNYIRLSGDTSVLATTVNLGTTGSALSTRIDGISNNLVSGISVTGSNSLTGLINVTGAGTVTFQRNGNTILISGANDSDITNGVTGAGTINVIPVWIGSSGLGNSIIHNSSSGIGINNSLPLAYLHVGTGSINNSSDAMVLISRPVDNTTVGNAHGYSDSSLINRAGTIGYNSYDSRIKITGVSDYNHYVSFQTGPIYGSTGTIANIYDLFCSLVISTGIVTNRYAVYVGDPSLLGGVLTNNYGIYIAPQVYGTHRYPIYSESDATSVFTGGIAIGTNSPSQKLQLTIAGGNDAGLRVHQNGFNFWDFYNPASTTRLDIRDVDGTYLTVLNLGNVGIKTTAPTTTLDVRGGITGASVTGDIFQIPLGHKGYFSGSQNLGQLFYSTDNPSGFITSGQTGGYSTNSNLASTGSTLDNKINSFSGNGNIVYITGTQNIFGAKTFSNDVLISGYYRNSVGGYAGHNLIPISADAWRANPNIFKKYAAQTAVVSIIPVSGKVAAGVAHKFSLLSSGTAGSAYYIDQLIAINPDNFYRGKIWASKTDGTGTFYAGYVAYDSGLNTLNGNVGSYGTFIASNQIPSFAGNYFSGTIVGEGTTINTFPTGTRYIRPLIITNYGDSPLTGAMSVADFEISATTYFTDLEGTGILLKSQLESTGTNLYSYSSSISGNLQTTGSILDNKIISLSGSVNSFSGPFVTGINITGGKSFTGLISFTGSNIIITMITGQVGITGNFINISGDTTKLATTVNLTSTGSILDGKVNILSGWISTNTSNIVYTTGSQTIAGTKTFSNDPIFPSKNDNYIPKWSGSTLTPTGIIYDDGNSIGIKTTVPLALLHIGTGNINNSSDSQVLISRTVDNSVIGNGHGFSDSSLVNRIGDIGYNSYDARVVITGVSYNHYASFQAAPVYGATGTVSNIYAFYSAPIISTGIVTNSYGAYISDPSLLAGTLTNNYGIYIAPQVYGTTKRPIFSESAATSVFTGGIAIGTNSPSQKLQLTIAGGNDAGLRVHQNGFNFWDFYNPASTTRLDIRDVDGTYLTVLNLGNVGIKTTAPTTTLDVRGGITGMRITGATIKADSLTFDRYTCNQLNSGYSGATNLTHIFNFNSNSTQLVTLSGVPNNIFTFSGAGMGAGKELKAIVTTTGIITGVVYPTAWTWINQKPSGLAAGTKFVITLTCTGSNDDGVIASFGRAVAGGGVGTTVQGNGTTNYIPLWSNSTTLANSTIIDDSLTAQATGNFGVTGNLTTNALIISSQKVNFIGNNVSGGDPKINTLSIPVSSPVFGGISGLMGVPAGWLQINISGNSYKLPYYN